MAGRYCYENGLPFSAMVTAECTNVGLNILFKASSEKGLSYYVFVLYMFAISTLLLLPLVFVFRGFSGQLCNYKGVEFSSATLASAISNLTPAFTFILAVIFRMENLALRCSITQAKIMGTIVSISGALVVVFYKGPTIISSSQSTSLSLHSPQGTSETQWVIGGLLLAASNLLFSGWYIVQTQVMKIYPAEIVVVFLYLLCATIISAPVCLIVEGNLNSWILRPDITLVAVIYSGFFGSSFNSVIHTWCLHLKGPVYVSIFKPLSIVIAAAMGVIFLGDALYLGSIIGAIILSIGFYGVIWAKAKEELRQDYCSASLGSSSDDKTPLLDSYKSEDVE
ncbi:WAT1-related protein At5g40230-like isoform X2 [Quercus robur]|uniref:WAT1-related protein At5g40230-like isoform X2 n=1 Tax=Quercus robur TaxID=38942 RepID=UPI00216247AE|nr:WAT1-related protein At5g40230-like isoform X2 [Quercus robur]